MSLLHTLSLKEDDAFVETDRYFFHVNKSNKKLNILKTKNIYVTFEKENLYETTTTEKVEWTIESARNVFDSELQTINNTRKIKRFIIENNVNEVLFWTVPGPEEENEIFKFQDEFKKYAKVYIVEPNGYNLSSIESDYKIKRIPNKEISSFGESKREIDLRVGFAFTRLSTSLLTTQFSTLFKQKCILSYGPCQFPVLFSCYKDFTNDATSTVLQIVHNGMIFKSPQMTKNEAKKFIENFHQVQVTPTHETQQIVVNWNNILESDNTSIKYYAEFYNTSYSVASKTYRALFENRYIQNRDESIEIIDEEISHDRRMDFKQRQMLKVIREFSTAVHRDANVTVHSYSITVQDVTFDCKKYELKNTNSWLENVVEEKRRYTTFDTTKQYLQTFVVQKINKENISGISEFDILNNLENKKLGNGNNLIKYIEKLIERDLLRRINGGYKIKLTQLGKALCEAIKESTPKLSDKSTYNNLLTQLKDKKETKQKVLDFYLDQFNTLVKQKEQFVNKFNAHFDRLMNLFYASVCGLCGNKMVVDPKKGKITCNTCRKDYKLPLGKIKILEQPTTCPLCHFGLVQVKNKTTTETFCPKCYSTQNKFMRKPETCVGCTNASCPYSLPSTMVMPCLKCSRTKIGIYTLNPLDKKSRIVCDSCFDEGYFTDDFGQATLSARTYLSQGNGPKLRLHYINGLEGEKKCKPSYLSFPK
ncbi:hypothetical protein EIN_096440 [Entamoeba invadens IP1]|uniref:DNA topoisomerase n=1 Tax=Entamoeba invadens IP1 TaxID=370355 RepID=A0A0A1U0J8_ENTIV|nr:hypothetical protein EIN_096440 [Entamoeba invadens IP1]ELP87387.1 hypothetical protein EIN_096440 [Entamoeba invadens IP1]|eukprot:XP_004254158.1 hypothetical protein EIN_096440 [Entamoeba invadens IP1]